MKKVLLLLSVMIFLSGDSFSKNLNSSTVLEQLKELNAHWKSVDLDYEILQQKIPLTNDVSLIQMHLSLVEKTLRNKDLSDLSEGQKQNRKKCLDILHEYAAKGVFPKNLFHTNRTPYFIDKFGTACAVGQLIISTGHEKFAQKVKEENNYAYISELSSQYPEVNEWADAYGFTIEELGWIQPCYCFSTAPGTSNVTCHGGFDGYFYPAASGGVAPYTYNGWYKWNGSTWDMLWCGGCDLAVGDYKCTVTDAVGTVQDYFATITQPSAINQTVSSVTDNGSCNGSASVVANGGTPGYTYLWAPGGSTSDSISSLCQGSYTVTITDASGCVATNTVNVSLAASIAEHSKSVITVFPNPASNQLNIDLKDFFVQGKTFVSIYNSLGQKISTEDVESVNALIDLKILENGVYVLKVENGKQIEKHQFIKSK